MVGRPKRKDAIQQTTSWRPRTKEIKDKWTELGAGRWLNRVIEELLGKKDEVPPKQP